MKQNIKYSLIGIGLYLLAGIIFYGHHPYMLPTFLAMMAVVSFFTLKKKNENQVRNGLLWANFPILALLLVTSLFAGTFRAALPYLIFAPMVAMLVYYAIFPNKRIAIFAGILVIIVISLLTFNTISGNDVAFDNSYIEMYRQLIVKR